MVMVFIKSRHALNFTYYMYLSKMNKITKNSETLKAMNIKYDHERLKKFRPPVGPGWDDARYTGAEYVEWGASMKGRHELHVIVLEWIRNIRLGEVRARRRESQSISNRSHSEADILRHKLCKSDYRVAHILLKIRPYLRSSVIET